MLSSLKMVSSVNAAVVGLLIVLSLAQPQRLSRCRQNVRCPCGYSSGGVTQERSCGPNDQLNPQCCTDSKIPPFIVPLSPPQRFSSQSSNFGGLNKRSISSLNVVPFETVDDIQSTQQSRQKVPGEASSDDGDLIQTLEHFHERPRATEFSQTYSSAPEVKSKISQVKSTTRRVESRTDSSLGFNRPVANITHVDLIELDRRVLGGNQSYPLKHAWLVFITFEARRPGGGTPICGGTLISSLFVLTTAHCFFELDGSRRRVKKIDFGRFDLNDNSEKPAFTRWARDYFVHPEYNQFTRTQIDDIALILLDAPSINADTGILPALLPSDTENPFRFDDLWARVAGWGGQGPTETFNSKVRETCMQVKAQCCQHHFQNFVPSKQMCLLGPFYTDICAGDSGSPFVVQGFNGPTVIALVSYGSNECGDNKPTINTAVQYYMPWIRNILRANEPFYDLNRKQNVQYADITCDYVSCTF